MRYTFRRFVVYEETVSIEASSLDAAVRKLAKDKFEFINTACLGPFSESGPLGVICCKRQDGEREDDVPEDVLLRALMSWAEESGVTVSEGWKAVQERYSSQK